ncbi:hypothetical protein DICPUDRAFT_74315 [Dictyostelium purpureum]|uniref:Uncharacterized protein n=1 Tax=Dictyostelium purpureum TaxID=5786 RepID=F0Z7D5_DICPU|nr:uncharacterized protein DICPUDRAFT_74315 [Dictyostelium purpureum]EGC40121.1 hypothetical protein DICPUDRAFT_74315 [Dictyostelium purpureum]|eukprot:XP_003283311.1 hypothetical protein DICPUDRAFT_74315 [Dictyostelium purpureum]
MKLIKLFSSLGNIIMISGVFLLIFSLLLFIKIKFHFEINLHIISIPLYLLLVLSIISTFTTLKNIINWKPLWCIYIAVWFIFLTITNESVQRKWEFNKYFKGFIAIQSTILFALFMLGLKDLILFIGKIKYGFNIRYVKYIFTVLISVIKIPAIILFCLNWVPSESKGEYYFSYSLLGCMSSFFVADIITIGFCISYMSYSFFKIFTNQADLYPIMGFPMIIIIIISITSIIFKIFVSLIIDYKHSLNLYLLFSPIVFGESLIILLGYSLKKSGYTLSNIFPNREENIPIINYII